MNKEQLNDILEKHKKWLEDEEDGERANLSYADLSHTNLSYTDLSYTDLSHTNLSYADLSHTNLSYTDLSYTDLSHTNLSYTDLSHTDLSDAALIYTDLSHTALSYANLRGTALSYANLRGTDLRGTDLDFSSLPLWCGSLGANFDDRQLIQIAYHLVKAGVNSNNASAETKKELSKLTDFANKFHRVEECGRIKKEVEE